MFTYLVSIVFVGGTEETLSPTCSTGCRLALTHYKGTCHPLRSPGQSAIPSPSREESLLTYSLTHIHRLLKLALLSLVLTTLGLTTSFLFLSLSLLSTPLCRSIVQWRNQTNRNTNYRSGFQRFPENQYNSSWYISG